MDRGAWQATVHSITKSWTQLNQLNMHSLPLPRAIFFKLKKPQTCGTLAPQSGLEPLSLHWKVES